MLGNGAGPAVGLRVLGAAFEFVSIHLAAENNLRILTTPARDVGHKSCRRRIGNGTAAHNTGLEAGCARPLGEGDQVLVIGPRSHTPHLGVDAGRQTRRCIGRVCDVLPWMAFAHGLDLHG